MKLKIKRSKSYALAWLFGALSAVLCICLAFATVVAVRFHRNNMFSRAVLLENNYFMSSGTYPAEEEETSKGGEVPLEMYIGSEAEEWDFTYYYSSEYEGEAFMVVEHLTENYDVDLSTNRGMINGIMLIYKNYGVTVEADRQVEEMLYHMIGQRFDLSGMREPESITLDVPYISQEGILPNGCEAVSATMLLRYYGFEISAEDFVDGYLDMKPVSIRWGCRYGPNPKYFYAGDPRSEKEGWGCFAPVIERALNKYLPEGCVAENTTGASLNTLKEKYVSKGVPVAVWVTVGMEEVDRILQWQSEDRSETFLYPANEHCMVMVGYDAENYIFADPYGSNGVVAYPIDACVIAFNSLGMQSVVVLEE